MKTISIITTRNIGEYDSGTPKGMKELQEYMQTVLPSNAAFAILKKKNQNYVVNNECVWVAFYGPMAYEEATRCKFYRYRTTEQQPVLTEIPSAGSPSAYGCVLVAGEEYICSYIEGVAP